MFRGIQEKYMIDRWQVADWVSVKITAGWRIVVPKPNPNDVNAITDQVRKFAVRR